MLEKNPKITILHRMAGYNEDSEVQQVVPQNSLSNVRQRLGLCSETAGMGSRSVANYGMRSMRCPQCENMAKNFLYLESLIRHNTPANCQCKVCASSLKYLEYINQSIMQVFGGNESIIGAARALNLNQQFQHSSHIVSHQLSGSKPKVMAFAKIFKHAHAATVHGLKKPAATKSKTKASKPPSKTAAITKHSAKSIAKSASKSKKSDNKIGLTGGPRNVKTMSKNSQKSNPATYVIKNTHKNAVHNTVSSSKKKSSHKVGLIKSVIHQRSPKRKSHKTKGSTKASDK